MCKLCREARVPACRLDLVTRSPGIWARRGATRLCIQAGSTEESKRLRRRSVTGGLPPRTRSSSSTSEGRGGGGCRKVPGLRALLYRWLAPPLHLELRTAAVHTPCYSTLSGTTKAWGRFAG